MNVDDTRPSWASTPISQKNYYPALDGLRGLAILLVVSFHCFNGLYESGGKIEKVIFMIPHLGWIGVPIFFCLSGFLVSLPFWKAKENKGGWWPKNYTAKRAIRIIPSFYLSIIFSAVLGGIVFGNWGDFAREAVLWATGAGLYTSPTVEYFNGPFWSLIIEIQFYIILPFLFYFARNLRPAMAVWFVVGSTVALSIASRLITLRLHPDANANEMADYLKGFFSQMDLFAFGMIFSFLVYYKKGIEILRAIPHWVLIGAFVFFGFFGQSLFRGDPPTEPFSLRTYELRHVFAAVGSLILILVQLHPHTFLYWFFSRKWIVYLGAISYEWYLFHDPIRFYIARYTAHLTEYWQIVLFSSVTPFVAGLLVSILVHHAFYLPVSSFLRKKFVR